MNSEHVAQSTGDSQTREVTTLLKRWRDGDGQALDELFPKVYDELRHLAERAMRREREDHTLQATALVNEAYLRLVGNQAPNWRDRVHFFAVAARMMRRILIDHARRLTAIRRGGGASKVELFEADGAGHGTLDDLLDLDRALTVLAATEPRKAQVLELRFFSGLTLQETAEVLRVSKPTVILDARLGRAMLYRWIQENGREST